MEVYKFGHELLPTDDYPTPCCFILTVVFGTIFVFAPLLMLKLMRRGPHREVAIVTTMLTTYHVWLVWCLIVWSQCHPLQPLKLKTTTLTWIAYKWGTINGSSAVVFTLPTTTTTTERTTTTLSTLEPTTTTSTTTTTTTTTTTLTTTTTTTRTTTTTTTTTYTTTTSWTTSTTLTTTTTTTTTSTTSTTTTITTTTSTTTTSWTTTTTTTTTTSTTTTSTTTTSTTITTTTSTTTTSWTTSTTTTTTTSTTTTSTTTTSTTITTTTSTTTTSWTTSTTTTTTTSTTTTSTTTTSTTITTTTSTTTTSWTTSSTTTTTTTTTTFTTTTSTTTTSTTTTSTTTTSTTSTSTTTTSTTTTSTTSTTSTTTLPPKSYSYHHLRDLHSICPFVLNTDCDQVKLWFFFDHSNLRRKFLEVVLSDQTPDDNLVHRQFPFSNVNFRLSSNNAELKYHLPTTGQVNQGRISNTQYKKNTNYPFTLKWTDKQFNLSRDDINWVASIVTPQIFRPKYITTKATDFSKLWVNISGQLDPFYNRVGADAMEVAKYSNKYCKGCQYIPSWG